MSQIDAVKQGFPWKDTRNVLKLALHFIVGLKQKSMTSTVTLSLFLIHQNKTIIPSVCSIL